jgi:hypothetical protein
MRPPSKLLLEVRLPNKPATSYEMSATNRNAHCETSEVISHHAMQVLRGEAPGIDTLNLGTQK